MIGVKLTTSGIDRLTEKVSHNANFLGTDGMRRIMQERGQAAVTAFKERIETFDPGEVQDLKEKTKKQKYREVGFIYPILKRTSAMMNAMYSYVRLGPGWTISIRFRGEQNRIKADAHITGSGNLPPRDFMVLPHDFSQSVFDAIRRGFRR